MALGHVTNYAQNMDGMVWDLTMLKSHLGELPGSLIYNTVWYQCVTAQLPWE